MRRCGGLFDFAGKCERLEEIRLTLEDSQIWEQPELAKTLTKEQADLTKVVTGLREQELFLADAPDLVALIQAEDDEEALQQFNGELAQVKASLERMEFTQMFSGQMDSANAYLDIQAGSGGTEAQDWAEMLLRMYLRWGEQHGFRTELIEVSPGEVAGIKSATIRLSGEYAYGWLHTETGVHRLVRKSPFDSGNRRHTSFAAVFVSPKWRMISRSKSIPAICVSIRIAPVARAGSTSIVPIRRCVSPICPPISSCNVRTIARSIKTKRRR
jgi:peptide chain release factor 2